MPRTNRTVAEIEAEIGATKAQAADLNARAQTLRSELAAVEATLLELVGSPFRATGRLDRLEGERARALLDAEDAALPRVRLRMRGLQTYHEYVIVSVRPKRTVLRQVGYDAAIHWPTGATKSSNYELHPDDRDRLTAGTTA